MAIATNLPCVIAALASIPAIAREDGAAQNDQGPEQAVGMLAHGVRKPFRGPPPANFAFYEGEEERGTADIQIMYRSAPLTKALKPRLTAKLQLNTAGRTSFASIGAEWRQHVLDGRVYGQTGIGLTLHNGYRNTPDPFVPGLSSQQAARRYDLYLHRTSFGSRVLFNPNLSIGVRVNKRWAVEATFEHFSHAGIFADQNPGINNLGVRLVRAL
jgi:lipid A 3-O-deacylase